MGSDARLIYCASACLSVVCSWKSQVIIFLRKYGRREEDQWRRKPSR